LKRKRDGTESEETNQKLKEFLGVMQASAKSRTWQNEATDGMENTLVKSAAADHDSSDEEMQEIGTKTAKTAPIQVASTPEPGTHSEPVLVIDATEKALEVPHATSLQTDDDWLRSRTSRLLDLEEDEEREARLQDEEDIIPPEDRQVPPEILSATVEETQQEIEEPTKSEELESQAAITRGRGRLYLRNLPFTATEDELRDHFVTYGALEEVRSIVFFHKLSTCRHDV
jgi:multiple RNA-binding domain-containing protein 1